MLFAVSFKVGKNVVEYGELVTHLLLEKSEVIWRWIDC